MTYTNQLGKIQTHTKDFLSQQKAHYEANMNILHHKIIFNALVRQDEDMDDASLDFGRGIVLGLYTEGDLYTKIDSLTLVCDREEVACECYEFTLSSPVYQLSVTRRAAFALEAWSHGIVIAGGIWQLVWSKEDQRYTFQTVSATGIDLVHVDGHQRQW